MQIETFLKELQVRFAIETCCTCGTMFGIEFDLHDNMQRKGQTFYCPNGHAMTYTETETDRLKKQLSLEAKRRERLETSLREAQERTEREEHRTRYYKGRLTKLKNEFANGICPCCGKAFLDLQQHMAEQHPDYEKEIEEVT